MVSAEAFLGGRELNSTTAVSYHKLLEFLCEQEFQSGIWGGL